MGADELYRFPTPTEAFGVKNNQKRSAATPSQERYQPKQEGLPPLHHNQNSLNHPRSPAPSRQGPPHTQRIPSHQSSNSSLRQQQQSQQELYNAGNPSSQQHQQRHTPARLPPQATYSKESAPSINSGHSGYAPSAYSQLPQPPSARQPEVEQVDPSQILERQLRDLFDRVDRDRDGRLTEDELAQALLNNDGTNFKNSTVRLMIRLFDTDDSSTIEFKEFYHLWNYILHWRKTFQRFDVNQNQRISFGEYQSALESFGYRLPTDIVLFVFQKFGDFNANKPMSLRFDMFVESLVWLLRCTNVFKKFDTRGNGVATIPFQDFVHEIISFI